MTLLTPHEIELRRDWVKAWNEYEASGAIVTDSLTPGEAAPTQGLTNDQLAAQKRYMDAEARVYASIAESGGDRPGD